MVRGCQKKTVHIRDTGSRYYEEAFFILRPDVPAGCSSADMIEEATRIAEESLRSALPSKKRSRISKEALFFIFGVISGALSAGALLLIILL